ncbi:hypothetical protein GBA52_009544 [Prunus armeniaca]|nr:hypothetical protein GBA52_009544 [Prunus armeniaca]
MEKWDIKTLQKNREARSNRHSRENPSFSSTLLDTIYRSIDEPNTGEGVSRREEQQHLIFYKETTKKKQSTTAAAATTTTSGRHGLFKEDQEHEIMSLRRACLIEKWMEKKVTDKSLPVRRNSMADFDTKKSSYNRNEFFLNSSSSSSDSSCGGGFSSSESESMYGSKSRSSSSCYSMHRPKPIRTSISSEKVQFEQRNHHNSQKTKHENSFVKTKSKALKIYGDLKKVRQPISPGGRLASFLNSLFNAGHVKKSKIDGLGVERKPSYDLGEETKSSSKSGQQGHSNSSSTCSSASSFSRSCLRKTPLSRSELSGIASNNGDVAKRSVRFCPVSVIVDEDCRPCGQKTLHEAEPGLMAAEKAAKPPTIEDIRVEQVARDYLLLKNYQKKNVEEEDEDDDAESYASSDLFELDTAGVEERYREELPVYETTFFDRNRAISNRLIL